MKGDLKMEIKYTDRTILNHPKQNLRDGKINNFEYKVISKDDFIKYRLNSMKASRIDKNTIDKIIYRWDELRDGYNFIIGVGKIENIMFCSVGYFSEHILGR